MGETAKEEEKKVYNAGMVSADTSFCHHYSEEGWHLNLAGLPSTKARKCSGVIYFKVGFGGKKFVCEAKRGVDVVAAGHDPCNAVNCAFMKETGSCPYMARN